MRDIIDDERQRLEPQSLAAQGVAAAHAVWLGVGWTAIHIPALVTPRFPPAALATRQSDFYHGLLRLDPKTGG